MTARLRTSSALVLVLATLALAGCQTIGATPEKQASNSSRIAGAMASAANDAATSGRLAESLAINEKIYRDDPNNSDRILAYARDLRRAGRIDDAKLVIRTPALGKNATEPMLTECALTLVAEGSYADAVGFAEKAIAKNSKSPDAHQALALAKSGLGDHAAAENAFAEALALWPEGRNQTAVINNLAMAQAAQGHVAQANATMAMATGEALRSEVYQNNRAFLSSLRDAPAAPKVSGIDVVDVTPVAQIDAEDSDAAMIMTPTKKPTSQKVGMTPRAPQTAMQGQALPVEAVERGEIESLKKVSAVQPVATPKEASISPAAGGSVSGPTPLFDKEPSPKAQKGKNWWNMGFTPNGNGEARGGLNK